jgi:hypothetical protein
MEKYDCLQKLHLTQEPEVVVINYDHTLAPT